MLIPLEEERNLDSQLERLQHNNRVNGKLPTPKDHRTSDKMQLGILQTLRYLEQEYLAREAKVIALKARSAAIGAELAEIRRQTAATDQRLMDIQKSVIHSRRRNLNRNYDQALIREKNHTWHDPSIQDALAMVNQSNEFTEYQNDVKDLYGCTIAEGLKLQQSWDWVGLVDARARLQFQESRFAGVAELSESDLRCIREYDKITQKLLIEEGECHTAQLCARAETLSFHLAHRANYWKSQSPYTS